MSARVQVRKEYRFGKRGLLRPGSLFRAANGPYYEKSDGSKVSLAEDGPFKFIEFLDGPSFQRRLVAFNRDGAHCTLFVGRTHRSRLVLNIVNRPYKISACRVEPRAGKPKRKGTKR